jgi:hypothetical protein
MTFKELMDAWNKSNKLKEFQAKLEEKRYFFLEDLKSNLEKLTKQKENTMTKEELENTLNTIIAFDALSQADKDEIEWIVENNMIAVSRQTAFHDFNRNLVNWYFWLRYYIAMEDFEIAAKLRDVIQIEKKEFILSISSYCSWFSEEEDIAQIERDEEFIKQMFI